MQVHEYQSVHETMCPLTYPQANAYLHRCPAVLNLFHYVNRLARPVDAYAMGFIGGCGWASNWVYVCEPAASMRICEENR